MHTHAQLRTRTCMRAMAAAKLTQVVSLVRRKLMHTPLAHTHARTLPHAVQVDTIGMRTEQPDGTRRPRPPLAIPAFPLNVRLSCLAYLACPSVGARAQKHLVSVCVCVGRTCKRPSVRKILILDSHKRLTGSKRRKRIVSAPWTWTYRPIAVLLHKCCVTMRPMRPTGRLR